MESIVAERGIEAARRIVREDDDFSFIRNHLTAERAAELDLFRYEAGPDGRLRVAQRDLAALHEAVLGPKFNFGAPRVAAAEVCPDGSLRIEHDHAIDGRGLDAERARRVLDYLRIIWRRPIEVHTVDGQGQALVLGREAQAA